MSPHVLKSLLHPISLAIAAVSIAVGLLLQFPFHEVGLVWKAEGGPIETTSAALWAVAALIGVVRLARSPSLGWLAGVVMLVWCVLRELDLQTAFTYRSVESLGFYTRSIASWGEKLLAVLILLPFAAAGIYLLRLLWDEFRSRRYLKAPWTGHVLILFLLVAISLGSEKILGFDTIEEVCELGLALVGVLLTWELAKRPQEERRT